MATPDKCNGCGVPLQADDEKKLGYVPPHRFRLKQDLDNLSNADSDFRSLLEYQPKLVEKGSMISLPKNIFELTSPRTH